MKTGLRGLLTIFASALGKRHTRRLNSWGKRPMKTKKGSTAACWKLLFVEASSPRKHKFNFKQLCECGYC